MKKVKINSKSKLVLTDIEGFVIRKVVPVGNSAKVPCPKEYLGREVYLVFVNDEKDKNNYLQRAGKNWEEIYTRKKAKRDVEKEILWDK